MTAHALRAEVLRCKSYGEHYHSLELAAPDIARSAHPGQFVNVRCGRGLLRRPFSIARTAGDSIEIMFDIRGKGTAYLAAMDAHDALEVLGPLGRGFSVPEEPTSCLLVGGGIGAAPLFFLGDHLRARGHRVDFLLGARRADLLLAPEEADRIGESCRLTTEDGSAGVTGRVTDVLGEAIGAASTTLVLACGPHPMLAAVTRVCSSLGVPVQAAVEELMACGWGVCMTCVIPVRDDGSLAYLRSCTEGPVFDGESVVWNGAAAPAPARQEHLVPTGTPSTHPTLPEDPREHPPPGN